MRKGSSLVDVEGVVHVPVLGVAPDIPDDDVLVHVEDAVEDAVTGGGDSEDAESEGKSISVSI